MFSYAALAQVIVYYSRSKFTGRPDFWATDSLHDRYGHNSEFWPENFNVNLLAKSTYTRKITKASERMRTSNLSKLWYVNVSPFRIVKITRQTEKKYFSEKNSDNRQYNMMVSARILGDVLLTLGKLMLLTLQFLVWIKHV